ncbi:MAG: hypothetical protein C4551_06670 [Bacillota bacterium]|nr:MAG: hypothetical protein C4551_06670 [Bacillota bacterium]
MGNYSLSALERHKKRRQPGTGEPEEGFYDQYSADQTYQPASAPVSPEPAGGTKTTPAPQQELPLPGDLKPIRAPLPPGPGALPPGGQGAGGGGGGGGSAGGGSAGYGEGALQRYIERAQPAGGEAQASGATGVTGADVNATPVTPGASGGENLLEGLRLSIADLLSMSKDAVADPEAGAAYYTGLQSIMEMLAQEEASLRAEYEARGAQPDQATLWALGQIKERLAEHLEEAKAELNRRGLFDSGVWEKVQAKIRAGDISETGRILSERLTSLSNQFHSALQSLRERKWQMAGEFTLGAAGAVEGERAAGEDYKRRLAQMRLEQRYQSAEAERQRAYGTSEAGAERAWRSGESEKERQFQAQQTGATGTGGAAAGSGDVTEAAISEVSQFASGEEAYQDLLNNMTALLEYRVDLVRLVGEINRVFGTKYSWPPPSR